MRGGCDQQWPGGRVWKYLCRARAPLRLKGGFLCEQVVFQIPCEDRCLDPQTPPNRRPLGGPNTSQGIWRILED